MSREKHRPQPQPQPPYLTAAAPLQVYLACCSNKILDTKENLDYRLQEEGCYLLQRHLFQSSDPSGLKEKDKLSNGMDVKPVIQPMCKGTSLYLLQMTLKLKMIPVKLLLISSSLTPMIFPFTGKEANLLASQASAFLASGESNYM